MEKADTKMHLKTVVVLASGVAAAVLIAGAISLSVSGPANAMPAYAQKTGKPCGYCHVNPAGGGALKPAGKKFQANGHKM
jgi:hypothetical protein